MTSYDRRRREAVKLIREKRAADEERKLALAKIKEEGLMRRSAAELSQAKELAKPEAAYWAAKQKEAEFTNYMNRQKAKEKGYVLPDEKEAGGIAGSGESWNPPSGSGTATAKAPVPRPGETIDNAYAGSPVTVESELSRNEASRFMPPQRSRASQVMMPNPKDLSWRQAPSNKISRYKYPYEQVKKGLTTAWEDFYGDIIERPYNWLTEKIARP